MHILQRIVDHAQQFCMRTVRIGLPAEYVQKRVRAYDSRSHRMEFTIRCGSGMLFDGGHYGHIFRSEHIYQTQYDPGDHGVRSRVMLHDVVRHLLMLRNDLYSFESSEPPDMRDTQVGIRIMFVRDIRCYIH